MSLFTTEKSIGGNIVTLVRNITLDDVEVEAYGTGDDYDINFMLDAVDGVRITLKESVVEQMVQAFGVSVCEAGRYLSGGELFAGITDTWSSKKIVAYFASVNYPVKFTGLKGKESRKARAASLVEKARSEFKASRETLIEEQLGKITLAVENAVNKANKRIHGAIERLVVDLNVKEDALVKVMSKNDLLTLKDINVENGGIEGKIAALKAQKKANDAKAYHIKRNAITAHIEAELGEKTMEIVRSFDGAVRQVGIFELS